ncbi:MAG TPA: hypothetical protein VE010_10555 [Thermoanaerobaculia bacterium]|nr:hypothetical protein [Thermoanaerobaculia bacterium]
MNKVMLGVILGAVLGVFDGATSWFTPDVRKDIVTIIIGSTFKGVIAGAAAGIFARKVKSTPAGIAFGLAVGLALAYAVAAMQDKYYFEIMLPGGTVGAILGWATQRYGRPAPSRGVAAAFMLVLALCGTTAYAGHEHGAMKQDANAAFEKLKSLAGSHNANLMSADGQKTLVDYRVTAGGSAIVERMFIGEPHEMMTVYTVDGDNVVATHYCAGRNQPVLRLNQSKSNANELVFDFVSISGRKADTYINGVHFRFDGNKVEEVWSTAGSADVVKIHYSTPSR